MSDIDALVRRRVRGALPRLTSGGDAPAMLALALAELIWGIQSLAVGTWIDERISMQFVSEHSATELLTVIPYEQPHFPLWYLFLDVVVSAARSSGVYPWVAVRTSSIVGGTVLLVAVTATTCDLGGRRAATAALVFVAVSAPVAYLSQLIRMYIWVAARGAACLLALVRLRDGVRAGGGSSPGDRPPWSPNCTTSACSLPGSCRSSSPIGDGGGRRRSRRLRARSRSGSSRGGGSLRDLRRAGSGR